MECEECERLSVERQYRKRIYELAKLKMDAAFESGDREQFMNLKSAASAAKIELGIADAEILQHKDKHALVN